jgi:hypothetical protein
MYIEYVLTYGQDNQSSGSDEQSDSDQSD